MESGPTLNTDYSYQPLESSRYIRLIRIVTGSYDASIQCEITHVELDAAPPYIALSYVWGPRTTDHQVFISGERLQITASLHHALKALAAFLEARVMQPVEELHVWADAICINQADIPERSAQVLVMRDIYSKAACVVTYMGPEEDDTSLGFEMLERMTEYYNSWERSDHTKELGFIYDRQPEELGLPPFEHLGWVALRKLLQRPWSRRIWIVQESVLNKKMFLMCGRVVMPQWDIFSHLARFTREGVLPFQCIADVSAPQLDALAYVDCLGILASLRNFFRTKEGSKNKSLYQLLLTCHGFESTDPRDKVYGLLGLAKDREALAIRPDYTRSVKDIYVEAAIRILKTSGTLDLFSSLMPDDDMGLPSWVPNWANRKYWEHLPGGLLFHTSLLRANLYQSSAGMPLEISFHEEKGQITLKGSVIDSIGIILKHAIKPSPWRFGQRPAKESVITPRKLLTLIQEIAKHSKHEVYPGSYALTEAFWRTLIANVSHHPSEAPTEYGEYFEAYMRHTDCAAVSGMDSNGCLPSDDRVQDMAFHFGQAVDYSRCGDLGLTKAGYLCRLPRWTLPNDFIAVLRGGRLPYVLRPMEGNKFFLVGDAYVHGLMKGEALGFTDLSENIILV